MVVSVSIRKHRTLSICAAEVLAVLEGLKLARSKYIVILECTSNSYLVVRQVNCFDNRLEEEGLLVEELNDGLQWHVLSYLSFSPRSANKVAHALARKALDIDNFCL